jgi:hypothetical protein
MYVSLCSIELIILTYNYVHINLSYFCIGIHNTKMYESAYKLMAKQVYQNVKKCSTCL